MARINTPQFSRHRFFPGESRMPQHGSALETKILRLEKMCQGLQRQPKMKSGVSSDELIEILSAERQRLKATGENQ